MKIARTDEYRVLLTVPAGYIKEEAHEFNSEAGGYLSDGWKVQEAFISDGTFNLSFYKKSEY